MLERPVRDARKVALLSNSLTCPASVLPQQSFPPRAVRGPPQSAPCRHRQFWRPPNPPVKTEVKNEVKTEVKIGMKFVVNLK